MSAALDESKLLDTPERVAYWLRADYPGITPAQLKQWARRGRIKRYPGERYEAKEVADYLDGRTTSDAARARTLAKRWPH